MTMKESVEVLAPDLIPPSIARLAGVLADVRAEVLQAKKLFPAFNSPHEGYSVILEELDELWAEVKANRGRKPSAHDEARQIAAMAVRYMLDLEVAS